MAILYKLPQLWQWVWQHLFIVVPAILIFAGILRTITTGEITFRDGRYLERDRHPLFFWAAVAFFAGFAILILVHFAEAY